MYSLFLFLWAVVKPRMEWEWKSRCSLPRPKYIRLSAYMLHGMVPSRVRFRVRTYMQNEAMYKRLEATFTVAIM